MLSQIEFIQILNTRELATLFWLFALVAIGVCNKAIRQALISIVKQAFHPLILKLLIAAFVYTMIVVYALESFNYWSWSELIKPYVIWFVTVSVPTIFASIKQKDTSFIDRVVAWLLNNLRFLVFFEFIVAMNTFSLIIELIFIPCVFTLTLFSAFVKNDKENKQAKAFFEWILAIIALVLIYQAFTNIWTNMETVATVNTAKAFYFGPIMSFCIIPFCYFLHLAISYDLIFSRIDKSCPTKISSKVKFLALSKFKSNTSLALEWSLSLLRVRVETLEFVRDRIQLYMDLPKRLTGHKEVDIGSEWSPYALLSSLKEFELQPILYQPLLEHEWGWGGETNYLKFNNSSLSNHIHFRVDGSEQVAALASLSYDATFEQDEIDEQLKNFLEIAKVLASVTIGSNLPINVCDAILGIKTAIYEDKSYLIKLSVIDYRDKGVGFSLKLKLIHKKGYALYIGEES